MDAAAPRDPACHPQQFILYATSPKLSRRGARDGGRGTRRVHRALLAGLRAAGAAKAWSWENCYEVRWERLADYVKMRIQAARKVAETPGGALLQIPQDTGSRGVAGRPAMSR